MIVTDMESDGLRRRRPWVIFADIVTVALAATGTIVLLGGPIRIYLHGLRLAVNSPWRPYVEAMCVLLFRNWLVPFEHKSRWVERRPDIDERRLFELAARHDGRALRKLGFVIILFLFVVAFGTWPQIRYFHSVPDLGDPLFSTWRLAWVAHQLPRAPWSLFDANIFYPERLTLAYSDAIIVPALFSAPLFWLGSHPLTIYTLLLLSAFTLSGVSMFLLVRALTGRSIAAAVAGIMFTLYPYRFEHYSHLELQMTMWMPVALWALHRTMARGRLADGLATGVAFGLQTLSSLYSGLFFAIYLIPLTVVLWFSRRCPREPLRQLVGAITVASIMIAPVAAVYLSSRKVTGEREPTAVRYYSAEARDYLSPHVTSRLYGRWAEGGRPERHLFPGLTPVLLSVVALWPPVSAVRIAYAVGLMTAFNGSLGFNGTIYRWLYEHFLPFRGLRAPARLSLLVGLSLSILSGYGVARILERWPSRQRLITAVLTVLVITDLSPRLHLEPVWSSPPAIYDAIGALPKPVILALPIREGQSAYDGRYLYFSTFRWYALVNGTSGYFPSSYFDLLREIDGFPNNASIDYLRSRGVNYIAVHGAFYDTAEYTAIVKALAARPDVTLISASPWEGKEARLYRLEM